MTEENLENKEKMSNTNEGRKTGGRRPYNRRNKSKQDVAVETKKEKSKKDTTLDTKVKTAKKIQS